MKCEVARDLITLYAEQLCSAECANELEAHLAECPECIRHLENYRKKINNELVMEKDANVSANASGLKPMKKIRKKLVFRKKVSIFLSIILAVVVLCIGLLSYGEMTNRFLSFSVIADTIKVKNVCESLVEGDTQALMDIIAFRIEDRYVYKGIEGIDDFAEYEMIIREAMDEAYEYYFKGKDIEVRVEEIMQLPPDEVIASDQSETGVEIGFYDKNGKKDEPVHRMFFNKVSAEKFQVAETIENPEVYFTSHMLPYDELVLDICLKYHVREVYRELKEGKEVNNIGAGLSLRIKKAGTEEEANAYGMQLREKIVDLYDNGWYMKDVMFDIDEYGDAGKWIYKVWFMMENQLNGNQCLMEQSFYYNNTFLYVIEDRPPMIMAADGVVPEEIKQKMMNLF